MKKLGMILTLILIVLTGLWVWTIVDSKQTPPEGIQQKLLTKQSSDQGEVVVEVTPISLEAGKEAIFNVDLNTHSVELAYDLMKVSKLVDEKGKNLEPISWNGGSGGHHLSGDLIFPNIGQAKSIELTIVNISGFDRKFRWNL